VDDAAQSVVGAGEQAVIGVAGIEDLFDVMLGAA
jgi:hypothetical protein